MDSPDTFVSNYTGDTTIQARVDDHTGDLYIKNTGVFHTTGDGEFAELETIIGGTGNFAGASGVLQVLGTFSFATSGQSVYTGIVCTP